MKRTKRSLAKVVIVLVILSANSLVAKPFQSGSKQFVLKPEASGSITVKFIHLAGILVEADSSGKVRIAVVDSLGKRVKSGGKRLTFYMGTKKRDFIITVTNKSRSNENVTLSWRRL